MRPSFIDLDSLIAGLHKPNQIYKHLEALETFTCILEHSKKSPYHAQMALGVLRVVQEVKQTTYSTVNSYLCASYIQLLEVDPDNLDVKVSFAYFLVDYTNSRNEALQLLYSLEYKLPYLTSRDNFKFQLAKSLIEGNQAYTNGSGDDSENIDLLGQIRLQELS